MSERACLLHERTVKSPKIQPRGRLESFEKVSVDIRALLVEHTYTSTYCTLHQAHIFTLKSHRMNTEYHQSRIECNYYYHHCHLQYKPCVSTYSDSQQKTR